MGSRTVVAEMGGELFNNLLRLCSSCPAALQYFPIAVFTIDSRRCWMILLRSLNVNAGNCWLQDRTQVQPVGWVLDDLLANPPEEKSGRCIAFVRLEPNRSPWHHGTRESDRYLELRRSTQAEEVLPPPVSSRNGS
jgi:hypothetical protein